MPIPTEISPGRSPPPALTGGLGTSGGDRPGRCPALHGGWRARLLRATRPPTGFGKAADERSPASVAEPAPGPRHDARAGHRADPRQPQSEEVATCHSLRTVPLASVQSRNELENPRPHTPSMTRHSALCIGHVPTVFRGCTAPAVAIGSETPRAQAPRPIKSCVHLNRAGGLRIIHNPVAAGMAGSSHRSLAMAAASVRTVRLAWRLRCDGRHRGPRRDPLAAVRQG